MFTEASGLVTLSGPTMGTRWSVSYPAGLNVDPSRLTRRLQWAVDRIDQQMSPWKPDSFLCRFGHGSSGTTFPVEPETATVLAKAFEVSGLSGGTFNPAVLSSVQGAGFSAEATDAPFRAAPRLDTILLLSKDKRTVRKTGDGAIDLCGIAKGYGADRLAFVMTGAGVQDFIAALDGEIVACGGPSDDEGWVIAAEAPDTEVRSAALQFQCSDMALASSGGYRHFRDTDSGIVTHTIDPMSGLPLAQTDCTVTVAAPTCMEADAWTTALTVLGEQAGTAMAAEQGLNALFITDTGNGLRLTAVGVFNELLPAG